MNLQNYFHTSWKTAFPEDEDSQIPLLECLQAEKFAAVSLQKDALEREMLAVKDEVEALQGQVKRRIFLHDYLQKSVQKLAEISKMFELASPHRPHESCSNQPPPPVRPSNHSDSAISDTTTKANHLLSADRQQQQLQSHCNNSQVSQHPIISNSYSTASSASTLMNSYHNLPSQNPTHLNPNESSSAVTPGCCPNPYGLDPLLVQAITQLPSIQHTFGYSSVNSTPTVFPSDPQFAFGSSTPTFLPQRPLLSGGHPNLQSAAPNKPYPTSYGGGSSSSDNGRGQHSSSTIFLKQEESNAATISDSFSSHTHEDETEAAVNDSKSLSESGTSSSRHMLDSSQNNSEDRRYTCDDCGRGFRHKAQLTTHERVHTGERPFGCSVCGKRFRQQSHVIQHLRVHTGERPHVCARCGKGFRQKVALQKHIDRLCANGRRSGGTRLLKEGQTLWYSLPTGMRSANGHKTYQRVITDNTNPLVPVLTQQSGEGPWNAPVGNNGHEANNSAQFHLKPEESQDVDFEDEEEDEEGNV